MRAIPPGHLMITPETQPSLMNQRGGLKRLAGVLALHLVGGEAAQFVVDQRQQFAGRLGIALFRLL
jgi:hypothetical protein